ncbi:MULTISPECIES: flagellar protein FlaG [Halorhodospira]|uniref:flagellar protein FlaG n=1 Tax=Halorhodospira TaxID=85108 RepID=UPI001EE9726C|nr:MULTISPECIES: flagellar protein FlaG [Halorhodospira]MCG5528804.1 flagellar protein FlaG [Halorhodospira halophila]MCG5541113.1 flagellar protein FlaG [Halorhodospira sp. M39old]MCG5543285.1 flagellar protein FlaG [Halorhodospira sp. 9628]MCG5545604.1 flagellar protein FlaG [Halorhodospira sp. M38]
MSEMHKVSSVTSSINWSRPTEQGEGRRLAPEQDTAAPVPAAETEERSRVPLSELEPLEHFKAEDPQALARAVERMEQFMQRVGRDLEFRVDDNTGKTVVTVYVRGTDDVVRQIPPEEMLAIAARMREVQGLLFNGEA